MPTASSRGDVAHHHTGADGVIRLRPEALCNKLLGQVNLALAAREHLRDGGSVTLVTGIATRHTYRRRTDRAGVHRLVMADGARQHLLRAGAAILAAGLGARLAVWRRR